MDFSMIAVGDVQNVLSAMQKNLECPICLDVIQEPVSTKCDHIFCRFCMFKLLSKKKKGVVECPLCKTEVTKRSLKENSRFKQLIEGLLETIRAFELDTGVKFLSGHRFPKTPREAPAAESLCEQSSVIQSKGFRKRKKSAKENGQENCTLQEANVDTELIDTRVKRCPVGNKARKCDSEKGVYIELGSDSSEEPFKRGSDTGLEDKEALQILSQEKLQEVKSAEKETEYSSNAQPDELGAKDIILILSNVTGESDLSKEGTRSITEYAKPSEANVTECQSSPLNLSAVDILTEQRDRMGDASPLRDGDSSFFRNTEEMDVEQAQCNSKSKELDLKDSSESRLDESKGIDIKQSVEAVEMYDSKNDSFHEEESPLEKVLQPDTPHDSTLNQVSRKRLKRSIQKVNEWFSKSNEILSSKSSQDDSSGETDVSGEGDAGLSDKDSSISEKTDPMVGSMEIAVVEGNKRFSKQTADTIKDRIFGKTYKRERKSNPPIILRDILPTTKMEDVTAAEKCLNNSSKDGRKRKRKSARVLQPEDFIKRTDTEEADGCPLSVSVNERLGEAEKKRCDESSAIDQSHLSENREDNTLGELQEGGGSVRENATEKVTGKLYDGEFELNNCDQKSTKKRNSASKKCRHPTRTMCALQLVVDRNSVSPDPTEPQIDSYPSSEEARKADSEQRQVRRSRRLQLLTEEMKKESGKGVVTKETRESDSDYEGSVFGVQRNVLVHTSECKDLCEPQGTLSCKPLAGLEGGDLEENGIQVKLKNLSDAAETAKCLFGPTSCHQYSNCSAAPDAGSQEGEIQGSPSLLQSLSMTVVQPVSQQTEEPTESGTAFPQDNGHDTQNISGDCGMEKLPMAKKVSELTKEAEDSELDTQYLRNIFRHSKRLSFSLYPPMRACAVEAPAAETVKMPRADQVENEHSEYLSPENLQEEKTAESLSKVCEKEKLEPYESACASPVTSSVSNTEFMRMEEHQDDVSQAGNQGNLMPIKMGTARTEDKNTLQKGERGNEKTMSADTGMERELKQNPVKSKRNQSDQTDTEKSIFKRSSLSTVDSTCSSSESNQARKAETVDSKGHFQSRSMIRPAARQQRPAEFNHETTEKKGSKRQRKQVKGNEEPATQAAGSGVPECSASETQEDPLKGNSALTGSSETPDGLLWCDDTGENTSFSDTDRRERSAVFVKRSGNALVKELQNRNISSVSTSQGIQRPRRKAQKLQSSDEDSSDDEELPCFQALIFGKSVSTPLQINEQVASVLESSVSPVTLPRNRSPGDNDLQKLPAAALSNGCDSPSQESECSVNLFSSQSNVSEGSAGGAQELKKPSIQDHTSKEVSNVNESKETFQSCNGMLKRTKTNFKDECQEDPNVGANLGEASGYDSETSYVEDSYEPFSQSEILTTQQKNVMQNNLKKLQQEMAVLEAVLKQHGSEDCELLPLHKKLPHSSSEGTLQMEHMGQERGAESASQGNSGNHKCSSSMGFSSNDFHAMPSDSVNSKTKELERERSSELSLRSSKSSYLKRPDLEKSLQRDNTDNTLKNKAPTEKTKPMWEAVQEYSQNRIEAGKTDEQKSGSRPNSTSVLSNLSGNVTRSPNNSSSSARLFNPQAAEATDSSVVAQNADKSCAQERKSKRSMRFPVSALHNAAGKENATSPVVTDRKEMSIVASGLNQSEHLMVQNFARKTQSTLTNHMTEGTTHVIMKTDKELVCERTLKYFLGIAGRKWVVSYQWVIQSFKEGRVLDEEDFEVRGDVVNGRNHQSPKRARQWLTGKIFKDFEICCYGPFTDMTTEHLERMVDLCGASVVKQLHLFTCTTNSTAVVVVQPDAWTEDMDYTALQQKNNVAIVTREWVLDSVALFECQELDAYLVS